MTALIIIGVLLLLFFLIGQIRVGADFSITDDRILLIATVAGFRLQLIPRKRKKKKAEEPPPKDTPQEQAPPRERPQPRRRVRKKKKLFFKIDLHDITEMLSVVAKGIRIFKHGFRLKRLFIHFTAASWDPYLTARLSACADAFLSVLVPLIENTKHCRDCDIRTELNFEKPLPELDFGIWITFRLGAAVEMGFYTLFGLLGSLLKIMFRFLWMKRHDPEEYDFRMNQQENPVTFFRRIMREAREQKETGGAVHDFRAPHSQHGETQNDDTDLNKNGTDPDGYDRRPEELAAENRSEVRKIAEQYAARTGSVFIEETGKDSSDSYHLSNKENAGHVQNSPDHDSDRDPGLKEHPEEHKEERNKSDGQHKE